MNTYKTFNHYDINFLMDKYNNYVESKYYITDINKKYTLKDMMNKVHENNFNLLFHVEK